MNGTRIIALSASGALVSTGDAPGEFAIVPNSPADKANLRAGDIIVEAGGKRLTEQSDLSGIIQRMQPGDRLTLTILREGEEREVEVVLKEWEER